MKIQQDLISLNIYFYIIIHLKYTINTFNCNNIIVVYIRYILLIMNIMHIFYTELVSNGIQLSFGIQWHPVVFWYPMASSCLLVSNGIELSFGIQWHPVVFWYPMASSLTFLNRSFT